MRGKPGENCALIAGTGADFQHAVVRLNIEQSGHMGDNERLRDRLSLTDGTGMTELYDFSEKRLLRFLEDHGSGSDLAFSPTSDQLVYTSDRSGRPRVYLCEGVDDVGRPLEGCGGQDLQGTWSSDGSALAIVGLVGLRLDLWVQPAELGAPARRLTNDDAVEAMPLWAPIPPRR